MVEEVMLTTIDNPYNPFTNSDELSDEDNEEIIYEAMKEICKYNISGVHRLIKANEVIDPKNVKTNLAYKLNEELKNKKSL